MENFKGEQLDIDFSEDYSKNKTEDFGGFLSNEERADIARHYKSLRPEIFFKINGEVFVREYDNSELVPVQKWFEIEEELNDNSNDWYK